MLARRSECSGVRAGTFLGVCDLLFVMLYINAIHVHVFMFFISHQEMQTCIIILCARVMRCQVLFILLTSFKNRPALGLLSPVADL